MSKTKSPASSVGAIHRRAAALGNHLFNEHRDLAAMWLDHLQRGLLTPAAIEREARAVSDIYRAIVQLKPWEGTEAGQLHRRLSQAIARELWDHGTTDRAQGAVLNALRAFVSYAATTFRPGWDSWTGTK
jgi:hypothetical protein